MPSWSIWLVVAGVLAGGEALGGDLVLVMLAGGAGAGAITAAVGGPFLLQVIIGSLVAILLVAGVRPLAKRHLGAGHGGSFGIERLVGCDAVVVQTVDRHGGRVRLEGQEWSARSFDPTEVLSVGDTVKVLEINGATAVVWNGP